MRLITKLWATLLLLCVAGVANAATKYVVDQKFTSVAALEGQQFAIVDETPETPTAMGIGISGHGNGWDMYFGTITEAYSSNACFYKLEAAQGEGLDGYYYLRTYKADGTMYTAWGDTSNMGYFNSQPATGGCCFALGLNNQNGQDGLNLAVWALEENEGKFALKNIGTGKYLHADNLPAKYDDAFYFTFCTLDASYYGDAISAIGDGGNYFISTDVDGTKYYITADGKLTNVRAQGCIFAVSKVEGNGYKQYGYYLDGGKRFTNANLSDNKAVLNISNYSTADNNRATWEAQVLFLNEEGKYAIRATNAAYGESSWADAGRVYFTWKVEDVKVIPQYTYDQVFQWNFEAATPINVSYQLAEADGTPVGDPVVVKQEANGDVAIPASITSVFYYDYVAEGTIGDADCTITVKRSMKSGVVHALTDLSNAKAYTMRCDRGAMLSNGSAMVSTAKFAGEPGQFAVVYYDETDDETNNGSYYLYSVADKQFVTNNGALAAMPTHGTEDAIKLDAKTDPYFLGYFTIGGTNNGLNTNGGGDYGYVINTWMTADGGNQYYFIEAADFDATDALKALNDFFHPSYFVTYVVKDAEGNVLFTSEPAPAVPGQNITTLPDDFKKGFTTYNEVDVTITDPETTVEFTATPNFPFAVATSFADATWYNMTIRSDYWVAMDETEPYYPKSDKDLDADASKWAFGGDAYKGIFLYNRAAGDGKTLTRDGDMAVMRDGDFRWEIFANSDGFVLRPTTGDDRENMWINQSGGSTGPLKFWNSANGKTDNGSTFRIKEATPVYAITIADAENGTVTADKAESKAGETVQLTITPAENYELDALTVVAANGEVVAVSRTYTFEMPAEKVSVTATFKEKGDEESPKNITNDYLVNADLSTVNTGWDYYSDAYKYQGWETGNENEAAAVEFYAGWGSLEHTNFKFSQTITLPAGDYRIAVNAFYREGNDGNGTNADKAWIFAGDKKKNVVAMNSMADLSAWSGSNDMHKAMAAFKSGAFENAFDFSLAEETTLELGFEGKFDAMRSWCILGPVQLWQYSLKDYLVAYNDKAIEVEALINSGKKMGAAELAALKASIVDESEFTLGSQVVAAIDVMNAALEAANNSIFGYAQLTAALEKGEDYKAHSVDDEAKSAYDLAINDVKTAYDAATVEDLAAALATVNAALPALAKTQTLAGSDLTVFIVNPEINGAEGWTIDRPVGGNGPLLGGNSFEYWAGNASNRAEASFDYWQEITGLPNGVYTVSADMYNSLNGEGGDYTVFSPTSGVYAASSDSEQARLVDVDGTELITYTTDQVIVLDGTLRIGVKNIMTPMAARWFVADNFKLTLERPLAEGFDSEYEHALAAIRDGANYSITTKVGEDTYYLTPDGKLTADADAAGIFGFKKVAGVQYDYGFLLTSQNDTRFSNPANTEEAALTKGALNTSTNNRTDWEAQVFFMNEEGKFAVRATNAGYNGETSGWAWIGNTYWAVHEGPLAEYSWEKSYDWELVEVNTVKVTYALYDAGGEEPVKNVVVTQKMNSEVVIPTSYTSVAYYDYVAEGTIGTEDCTIKVTRTYKAGLIFSLDDLSNTKAYTIACDRGALLTKDGYMASTAHSSLTSAAASNFAIINYQENYYLYSVVDGKFVTNSGALADVPANGLDDAIKIDPKDAPYFMYYFTIDGTDCGLNTNGNDPYGYVINTWMTADPGNLYYMIEAADFDPTAALTLLEKGAYLVPLREALANNEPNPVLAGEGLFQKPQAAYDTYKQIYDAQKLVAENEASSIADLIEAKEALDDAIEDYAAVEVNKPAAGQLYMFQHKSSGGYMGFNDAGNLFVLDDPDAFTWSEVEGGYNLNNGAYFIAVDGSTLLGNAEAGVLITATPVAASEDGQIYYNIITTTTDGKVRAITGSTANKKATLITTPTEKSQWTIVEYKNLPKVIEVAVQRYPGMGYGVTEATVDLTEAKAYLGVEELTTDMLSFVNPDGTEIDYAAYQAANYDGWCDADGVATNWGANTAICVKFFQAIPDGKFQICDMNGADEVGKSYTVNWALSANDKDVLFVITVTFAEAPVKYLADYTKKGEVQVNINVPAEYSAYAELQSDEFAEAEVSALIGDAWAGIFGVGAKVDGQATLTDTYSCDPAPGFWCLADGTADVWANGTFGVSMIFSEDYSTFHFSAFLKEANTEALSTTFYLVNEETKEYVAYVITVNAYDSIRDMQLDGKAEIYDLNGRKVSKIQRGGIYIVNGKRVAVK